MMKATHLIDPLIQGRATHSQRANNVDRVAFALYSQHVLVDTSAETL